MINFAEKWQHFDKKSVLDQIQSARADDVERALHGEHLTINDFYALISPAAEPFLQDMARKSQRLTRHHFGKVMQFYVPLYLSNACTNGCLYCGFHNESKIQRKILSTEEIKKELKALREQGFQNILLLTGSAPKVAGADYLVEAISMAKELFPAVSLEIYAAEEQEYKQFVDAGASGLTIYQECYHEPTYTRVHPAGRKADYAWRLATPDRALSAGFRKINIGALLGLYDWRFEAVAIANHAEHLLKTYWRSEFAISFPRLREMGRNFSIDYKVSDKNLVQMILAFRLFIPQAGLVLSTRESAELRDRLIDIGITQISAGSKTSPGGYSLDGHEAEQFSVADDRSLLELSELLESRGFEPVMKDWTPELEGIQYTGEKK